ncbi:MAG: hypothetical protein L3K15_07615 [Thermoplasmata archaeon]|nr:hypothetical protein [Thermoplasmata archaeon]
MSRQTEVSLVRATWAPAAVNARKKRMVVAASVVTVAVATVVWLLLTVPIAQESSGSTLIGAHLYSFESHSLFGSNGGWLSYSYRGVLFTFHLWCLAGPAGGLVCGNATESAGASFAYSFSDGPPAINPPWQTWVAPDSHEAVQYQQGGLVHLLVAV